MIKLRLLETNRTDVLSFGGIPPKDTLPTAVGAPGASEPTRAEVEAEQVVLNILAMERGSIIRVLRGDRVRLIEEMDVLQDFECSRSVRRGEKLAEELSGVEKRLVGTIIF